MQKYLKKVLTKHGGGREIRTLAALANPKGLANPPLQPLGYPSSDAYYSVIVIFSQIYCGRFLFYKKQITKNIN